MKQIQTCGAACAAVIGFAMFSSLAWAAETPSRSKPVTHSASAPANDRVASLEIESATGSGNQGAPYTRQSQAAPGSRIDFTPLPVTIYLMEGQKPTVAFTTPCIMIERMTNGFPPIMAFENFMFEVIGNINESDLLPIKIEPVCI
jgi:hypothetical protein